MLGLLELTTLHLRLAPGGPRKEAVAVETAAKTSTNF